MDISLISLKFFPGFRRLGSPCQNLLGNRSSICVFEFLTPSGVRRPVQQGDNQRALGCHGEIFGKKNGNTRIII